MAPGNEQESPDAKYLAEKNNRVDKETKAKDQTPFYRNAMPKQTATEERNTHRQGQRRADVSGNNGTGQDQRPAQKGGETAARVRRAHREAARPDRAQGRTRTRAPGARCGTRARATPLQGNAERLRIQPGRPGEEGDQGSAGQAGLAALSHADAAQAAMDKIIGAAPNDHLQDVEEGDGTFLNTREWKYASFFNRVKQSVGRTGTPTSRCGSATPPGRSTEAATGTPAQRDARAATGWSRTSRWRDQRRGLPGQRRPSCASSARSPSPTRRRA